MSAQNLSKSSEPNVLEPIAPAPLPRKASEQESPCAHSEQSEARGCALTLISFGFKYGRPAANHFFDVSFLKNPAREDCWGLWSEPEDSMRRWILEQSAAQEFLAAIVPLAKLLARADDGVRIALGCSAGRHRSTILIDELARRLRGEGLEIRVFHREQELK